MTKPARDANLRWLGLLLAALVAVLITLLGAGTASAATATTAQTRVGPHTLAAQVLVGPGSGIGAGQRLGNDAPAYDFVLATGVAAKTASGAESAGAARNLGRQLASEQQMSDIGTSLAGSGSKDVLKVADRLATEYGGASADWAKMGSSSFRGADGFQFETHWYENVLTGVRTEFKTKFLWLP